MTWKAIELEENNAEKLAQLIEEAETIVIGIGAGMSAADGFTYIGERFTSNFKDFVEKYKFLDMLQASLFDFPSSQEYWAFQSRFVLLNYFDQPVGDSYLALKNILKDKNYHIITTNADNAFDVAGYDMDKVFHIQGKYGLMQCSKHCHAKTYQDEALMRRLAVEQENMEVDYRSIPLCPECGAPLEVNKRNAEKGMVEDPIFFEHLDKYNEFLEKNRDKKTLFIEIGVGFTTPQFIKYPFYRELDKNSKALMITMNQKKYQFPERIASRVLWFNQNSKELTLDVEELLKKNF